MTDAINTNNRIKAANQPTEQRGKNTPAPSASATSSHQASAVVDLSSTKVLEQIAQLPEIDNNRIESIKSALAKGEYRPDPEIIARKFAEIEKLLA